MGRPLKIQKYSLGTSISAGAVAEDQAYPSYVAPTSMDLPTVVSPGPAHPAWTGVVGGQRSGAVSASYPVIECQVNIQLAAGAGAGVHNGAIIRQKGAHKYLVEDLTTLQDEDIIVGNAYKIATLGTTNWKLFGAPADAVVGTIFTATANGSNSGTGTAHLVGICVLGTSFSPTAGNMVISYTNGDSTATPIAKLTNKFLLNWDNFQTKAGTPLTSYASNSNVGEVIYSGEGELAANFFTDEGSVAKSGSEANSSLGLAIVENYIS